MMSDGDGDGDGGGGDDANVLTMLNNLYPCGCHIIQFC
jgi:hypothetical protein